MEKIKNTPVMDTSLDKEFTWEDYRNFAVTIYRESHEGKRLEGYLDLLNRIANVLLEYHEEENCCSEHRSRHFKFQCPSNEEHVIASYHT